MRLWSVAWVVLVSCPAEATVPTAIITLGDPQRTHAERWEAVRSLEGADPSIARHLIPLLDDPASRYYAVRALSLVKDPHSASALARVLGDRSWPERRYAALAIGQIGAGSPEVIHALENALDDELTAVREDALLALTELDPRHAKSALDRFYLDQASRAIRIELLHALPIRLKITNQTTHPLILPPPALVLIRGLRLIDAEGHHAYPAVEDHARHLAHNLDPLVLEAGASHELEINLAFEGAPRKAVRAGGVRYLLHSEFRGGELSLRVVWHPAFAADLVEHSPRRASFWSGKAYSEVAPIAVPEL